MEVSNECNCTLKPNPPRTLLGVVVPAIVLVLLPKCPLCIVAYAAALGVGVSFSTAAILRAVSVVAAVVTIVVVMAREPS